MNYRLCVTWLDQFKPFLPAVRRGSNTEVCAPTFVHVHHPPGSIGNPNRLRRASSFETQTRFTDLERSDHRSVDNNSNPSQNPAFSLELPGCLTFFSAPWSVRRIAFEIDLAASRD
jgi:hypothetical protein